MLGGRDLTWLQQAARKGCIDIKKFMNEDGVEKKSKCLTN